MTHFRDSLGGVTAYAYDAEDRVTAIGTAMSRKLDTGALTPRRLISSGHRHGLPVCHRPEAMQTDGNGGTPGRPGWNEEIADCREDVDEML